MSEEFVELEKLPYTTAECDIGPIIESKPGSLLLKYDVETEEGIHWIEITFSIPIALKITPQRSITKLILQKAYSRIGEIKDSEWINELRKPDQNNILYEKLHHYVIYFDHYSVVEIISSAYTIIK